MAMTTKQFKIIALPGDHIGPEILQEALPIFDILQRTSKGQYAFHVDKHTFGGACIDAHNTPLLQETVEAARDSHAILLGSVGGPKWDQNQRSQRPEWGIFELRRIFDLYANIRPAQIISPKLLKLSPLKEEVVRGADIIVVRENAGGIYFGKKQEATSSYNVKDSARASDECAYTDAEIKRLIHVAASLSLQHDPPLRIHSVDKANAMASSRLWRQVVKHTIENDYPQLAQGLTHSLVDSCAMVMARSPTKLNGVILTENLFGDILSDLSAIIPGSLGLLGSGELNGPPVFDSKETTKRPFGLYQPISGSAPDIAGKGIANPIGMISSVAMMLRWTFGLGHEADCIERAIKSSIEEGICTPDLGGKSSTADVGRAIRAEIQRLVSSSSP